MEKSLAAGTLIRLQVIQAAGVSLPAWEFFLGALCQRPLVQVLVKAWRRTKAGIVSLTTGRAGAPPLFFTSYNVFQSMLVEATTAGLGGEDVDVQVSVIAHTFNRSFWSMEQLEVTAGAVSQSYGLPSFSQRLTQLPKPTVPDLPFGLKLEQRKGKRKPRARAKAKAAPSGRAWKRSQGPVCRQIISFRFR